jgi:hypothetical protein
MQTSYFFNIAINSSKDAISLKSMDSFFLESALGYDSFHIFPVKTFVMSSSFLSHFE